MLPQEFLDRMQSMLGEEYDAFLASYDQEKYQALRVNTLKADRETFLQQSPFHLTRVEWAENGFYYEIGDQPGKHPYHEAGAYYIQEPSAMLPASLLEACPGERILDLCAAPGGKSTQIAAAMKGRGILICNEIHPARARILSENVERMGIRNAMVTNETPQKLAEIFPDYFDRIMVDAPCSGEGMFRKNEEACEQWSPENVEMCAARQDEILDCAAMMLRPGGKVVYSTCTFAPLEDEGSVERFIARHPEFVLVKDVRLWPHKVKGEGHYAAVLQRKESGLEEGCGHGDCHEDRDEGWNKSWCEDQPQGWQSGHSDNRRGNRHNEYQVLSRNGLERGITARDCGDYLAFEKETLKRSLQKDWGGVYLKFGEQLYLCPPQMPSVKGLKVLRPGLHLGTMKKNRFEPSHALALALAAEDVKFSLELSGDSKEVRDYLNGLTFSAQGEKGWYLITVDGYSIGWGKLAGGIMKNHYPKGLRKN